MTKSKLLINAVGKFAAGIACIFLLLFLPAGTYAYARGWLFVATLFIPMLILGSVLFAKAPDLLEKRLKSKEQKGTQTIIISLSTLMFVGGFMIAGFDYRYGWSSMPLWVSIAAAVVLWVGYAVFVEVLRENAYLSRTVEVQEGQKVVSTGLYGIVRHPMYSATLLIFMSMPLILGSYYSFIVFLTYPLIIGARIRDEERLLTNELLGYDEYRKKVRFKIIPHIW